MSQPPISRDTAREQVWDDLRKVARPDSRFAWDFAEFIADYERSDDGAERLLTYSGTQGHNHWLVTPDNNLDALRERFINRGISFLMPTYGIRRGFLHLDPSDVPSEQTAFAATLDGMTRFATRVPLAELEASHPTLDCMVTGASFVTQDGLRMGKGHGFFDLEWAMLRRVGVADSTTEVLAGVHDVQVISPSEDLDAIIEDHDTIVDAIVTPTQLIEVIDAPPKPEGINWSLLAIEEIESIPPLQTLWERDGRP